jgi:hypothetical protein
MTDLYLILHKVRGEPAFDIAEKVMIGNEEGWIIPTSGHRAHPAWWWGLDELAEADDFTPDISHYLNDPIWKDLPDHYSAKRDDSPAIEHFRALLGLNKPQPTNTYRRR